MVEATPNGVRQFRQQWYLDSAAYLFDRLERAGVEDHVVDNDDRPVAQVAADVLDAAGWLGTRSPDRG